MERVANLFEAQQVAYALIGASAVAARGIPRSTYDIDLLTVDKRVLTEEIWEPIRAVTTIEIRRGDFSDPLKGVVWLRPDEGRPIDVVVGRWKWQQKVIERAEPVQSTLGNLPTVTTADLILLKLAAGGPQDAWDIGRLLKVASKTVAGEVEERLPDLPQDARDLWQRIRSGV